MIKAVKMKKPRSPALFKSEVKKNAVQKLNSKERAELEKIPEQIELLEAQQAKIGEELAKPEL